LVPVCGVALVLALAAPVFADPCLVVYPTATCFYHYDVNEYYVVGPGDLYYDAAYDIGGQVLIEVGTNEVAYTVYQAPGLIGFTPSTDSKEGFFFVGHDFDVVVDGFNFAPVTYVNILLVFEPDPGSCSPVVTVDGNPALYDAGLGWYYPIGDLVVSTPTPDGNNYSDTATFTIHFDACTGLTIWAFADEDDNLMWTDSECFSAFSHDSTVPVEHRTWGGIKVLYVDE
jgi:hypothetical protein